MLTKGWNGCSVVNKLLPVLESWAIVLNKNSRVFKFRGLVFDCCPKNAGGNQNQIGLVDRSASWQKRLASHLF
jgi:hypothetical protein